MITITYTNHRNIDNIYFEGGWTGILYLDNTPKASDVKYISNVEVKNGLDIVKSKIVQEEHIIRIVASETMVKVMQKLPLCSDVNIEVDDLGSNKVFNLRFEVSSWIGGGAYAQCKLTYVINTFVNKNASI
jgi:hypothetical protein